MAKVALERVDAWLAKELGTDGFCDVSHNGLQVANGGWVSRVMVGVDASLSLLEMAAARGADCILAHHGLSWGDSLARLVGRNYDLVHAAMAYGIAVFGYHLPLDASLKYGNNAELARRLGVQGVRRWFAYHGQTIGVRGALDEDFSAFCDRVEKLLGNELAVAQFGSDRVRRIGIVSGGAGDGVEQAVAAGIDTFLTGEQSLIGWNLAEHHKINVIFGGHYATECFGIQALGDALGKKFHLPVEFVDLGVPV